MRSWILCAAALTSCVLPHRAGAYPVGPAPSLTELVKQSDLICKVVAVSSEQAKQNPYRPVRGFEVLSTELDVVEVYKGDVPGMSKKISFIHYAPVDGLGRMYMPQNYEFEGGKAYILFAKKSNREAVFQMLWENHKMKEDQGLVRAADDLPHGKRPIREVLWRELTKSLKSTDREDRIYAIRQLDQMGGGGYDNLKHFDRTATLQTLAPLMNSQDEEIATLVIRAIGSRNPYLDPNAAAGWLASIGKGHLPGYSHREAPKSVPAANFWEPLAEIADGDRPSSVRALAIRALGLTRVPELQDHVERWIEDPDPLVRQAAAVLLADFPELADSTTVERLAKDPNAAVRIGAAQAIGYGQLSGHLHLLAALLRDPDPPVTAAAAMNLLAFPVEDTESILEANIEHPQYRSLFVNALALKDPGEHLDALCEVIEKKLCPETWWGGSIPWGVSWNTLFKHVQRQASEDVKQGKFDKVLKALESPEYFGSSEPRDLYALYLQRGMKARAKSFRDECRKRITYDIDYYFDMVDKNPNTYQRN